MSQSFLSLPVGTPGIAVAVPVSEGLKTFYVGGVFEADSVILQVSPDGTKWDNAALVTLPNAGPVPATFSGAFARVSVLGLRSGTPVPLLGLNTITGTENQATVVVPAANGAGALVAVDTLPRQKTLYVVAEGDALDSEVVVEISMDDVNFTALVRLQGSLYRSGGVLLFDGFYKSARAVRLSQGAGWTIVMAADPTCC